MHSIDRKIVIVTRATQLQSLRNKYNTRSQARFQIVSAKKRELANSAPAGADLDELAEAAFAEVDLAAAQYDSSVQQLQHGLDFSDFDLPVQTIDREFLPNFVFGPHDIVVTVGQDGLVANTAKYVAGLPIVAVNPDPQRIDGVLLPFRTDRREECRSRGFAGQGNVSGGDPCRGNACRRAAAPGVQRAIHRSQESHLGSLSAYHLRAIRVAKLQRHAGLHGQRVRLAGCRAFSIWRQE